MTEQEDTKHHGGDEFEREPVPEKARLGFKSFIGMYAGEHCAGTELMIGPLFVVAGVSAFDVVVGLIVGNLLAVLSWMFLCAPFATRARLTLYYQLEKICGKRMVSIYNLANGVMFCFLAGAMITVSATAVGEFVDYPMPGLGDWLPSSVGWVAAVVLVGILISVVAAYGYRTVSRFANIAAPWMVLVFLAFGIVALKQFIDISSMQIRTAGDLWRLADEVIWRGGDPLIGKSKFTFWHVTFFAWFCNMAMHVGMSDLSVFRFAKKAWYASASAAGMYVGHFMAWLAASMLFALQLHTAGLISPEAVAAAAEAGTLPAPLPGRLANAACGLAGLICVVIAGWTTANPTIYRAGLAFQAIMPRLSRFRITLVAGGIATIAAVFPALAMKLLDFVALYGMILMPMGAIIFVDYWLLKRLGMKSYYAEVTNTTFYWVPLITWVAVCSVCGWLAVSGRMEIYFVSLPGWFVAAGLYILLSRLFQKKESPA